MQKFDVIQFGSFVVETSGQGCSAVRGSETFLRLDAKACVPTSSGANAIGHEDDFGGVVQTLLRPCASSGLTSQATGAGGVLPHRR